MNIKVCQLSSVVDPDPNERADKLKILKFLGLKILNCSTVGLWCEIEIVSG